MEKGYLAQFNDYLIYNSYLVLWKSNESFTTCLLNSKSVSVAVITRRPKKIGLFYKLCVRHTILIRMYYK
jgi:hypothetical protein